MAINRDEKLLAGLGDTLQAATVGAASVAPGFRRAAPSQAAGFAWVNDTDAVLTVALSTSGLPVGRGSTEIPIAARTMGTIPGCWSGFVVTQADPAATGNVQLYWTTYVPAFAIHGIRPDDVDWWLNTWIAPGQQLDVTSPWGGTVNVSGQVGFSSGGVTHLRIGSGWAGSISGSAYSGDITIGPLDRSTVNLNMAGGLFETRGYGELYATVSGNNHTRIGERATGSFSAGVFSANNLTQIGDDWHGELTHAGTSNTFEAGDSVGSFYYFSDLSSGNHVIMADGAGVASNVSGYTSVISADTGALGSVTLMAGINYYEGAGHLVRLGPLANITANVSGHAKGITLAAGAGSTGVVDVNTHGATIEIGENARPSVVIGFVNGIDTTGAAGGSGFSILSSYPRVVMGKNSAGPIQISAESGSYAFGPSMYGPPEVVVPDGMQSNGSGTIGWAPGIALPINPTTMATLTASETYTSTAFPVPAGSTATAWAATSGTSLGDLALTLHYAPWNAWGSGNLTTPVASASVSAGSRVATTAAPVAQGYLSFTLTNTGTATVTAAYGAVQWYGAPRGGE